MKLTPQDYALLEALDETGGRTTGNLVRMAKIDYGTSAHQRSAATRQWLIEMQKGGLVGTLDALKPVCWTRTAKGTDALRRAGRRR